MKVEIVNLANEKEILECDKFHVVNREDAKTSLAEIFAWNGVLVHRLVKNYKILDIENVEYDEATKTFVQK